MLAFLSYNGGEPGWASAMRESNFPGLRVYSPGLPLEDQLESIGDDLSLRKPNVLAYAGAKQLRLEEGIWNSLCDVLPALVEADSCTFTDQMVFRDLYLLVRSDVLIVDAQSTNELALYAALLGIPVIAVSYSARGLHPWLSHCAKATVHSPESVQEILDVFTPNTPNIDPPPEACLPAEDEPVAKEPHDGTSDCQDDCDEHETCREPIQKLPIFEYRCEDGHVFRSVCPDIDMCNQEDCGAEGVAECGSAIRTRTRI
jgi:hypothetical protein